MDGWVGRSAGLLMCWFVCLCVRLVAGMFVSELVIR